ncbi:MAG: phospholipid carrier-dependent glycosyltransferase [Candidatus Moranbacteria bacterium]|nr:phospholipid carrier-dependent glycosyltransferase [Candidatus Moranbacteria bacterium]
MNKTIKKNKPPVSGIWGILWLRARRLASGVWGIFRLQTRRLDLRTYHIIREKLWLGALIFIAVFIAIIHLKGSLQGDEAIYGQLVKETLHQKNFFTLIWRENTWFEKPPLYFWLLMGSVKLFGLNEISMWIVTCIFGIISVIYTFLFTKLITKNNFLSFFSGMILATIPFFVKNTRAIMTDVPLTCLMLISLYYGFKAFQTKNKKNLILFWIFLGLSLLIKNFVGLFSLFILILFLFSRKKIKLLFSRQSFIGFIAFLFIVLPWHIYMAVNYKLEFINQYLGMHILERMNYSIIDSPFDKIPFSYIYIMFTHVGVWFIVFCALIIYYIFRFKKLKKTILQYKNALIFLLIWFFLILIAFWFATTKLPHYILPIIPAMAILIAIFFQIIIKNSPKDLIIFSSLTLLNLTPYFYLNVSDFGESNILILVALIKIFNLEYNELYYFLVLVLIVHIIILIKLKPKFTYYHLILMLLITFLIPSQPLRGEEEKQLALDISSKIKKGPVNVYSDNKNFHVNTILFYLPTGSDAEEFEQGEIKIKTKANSKNNNSFCLFKENKNQSKSIYTINNHNLAYCKPLINLEPERKKCNFCLE